MHESGTSLRFWLWAAEDFINFVHRHLPVILAHQEHDFPAQLKTLLLLAALKEKLTAQDLQSQMAIRDEVARLCDILSRHLVRVLARLPRASMLEYREIVESCVMARGIPEIVFISTDHCNGDE